MNINISPKNTPAGTRLLFRNVNGFLKEATIREWAESGKYLNWDGNWISINETKYMTFVEKLSDDSLWQDKGVS